MRRLPDDPGRVFPEHLVLFDGRGFETYDEWTAGFDAWCTVREVWEAAHPGVVLPAGRELGECPNPFGRGSDLPHGGLWSRDSDGDSRCREHGLTVDEHYVAPGG